MSNLSIIPFEATPCDDCPFRRYCATREVACKAFHAYVNHRRWRNVERDPINDWWLATMANDTAIVRELAELA